MRYQHHCTHLLGLLVSLILSFPIAADAAKITKVTGKKVTFDLEGDNAKVGDIFVAYDSAGKRKGLIKVKVIKGSRAAGLLGKGKAEPGWTMKISDRTKGKTSSHASHRQNSTQEPPTATEYWGIIGGLARDTMTVKIDNDIDNTNETTVELSGMAFSLKGLFDYNLFSQVWFRGMFGLEGLNATGSTQAGCQAKACSANIFYLSADFWGRYVMTDGNIRPWIGGAFSLMFPASKKATVLEESSITNTSAISIGGGIDWFTSPTFAIPIQIEYSLLPKSETVEASAIAFRVGVLMPF